MAADSTVRLIVDAAKAVNPLRAVAATSKKAEQAIEKLKGAVERTTRKFSQLKTRATDSLRSIAKKARDAAASTGKFGKAAILAAAAAAAIATVKFSLTQFGELEKQTRSLQVLTGSLQDAKSIIEELRAFGAVTPFTSQELIETGKRLKAFGFETNKIVDTTKRLADVAGATGAELGGIALAFGQIQAKGRLQGEELLQLQERGIGLQDELQKMYGLTADEFRKALEGGRIPAEAVNQVLIKLTENGGKFFGGASAQADTLFGKLSTLQDSIQRFGANIGKVLAPVFKSIVDFLIDITNRINAIFESQRVDTEARKLLRAETGKSRAALFRGRDAAANRARLSELKEEIRARKAPAAPEIAVPGTPPALLAARGGAGTGESAAEKEAKKLEQLRLKELADFDAIVAKETQRQELLNSQRLEIDKKLALQSATSEEQVREIENAFQLIDLQRRFGVEQGRQFQEDLLRIEAGARRKKQEKEIADQQAKAAERLAQTYRTIGDAIKTGVVDSLTAAVEGTKSLAEVASNTLRSLANTLLKLGINAALGSLGGGDPANIFTKLFGGARANGGTVTGGKSFLVGERGPELFTPGRTGSIAPNNALMGSSSIVVNVDATGSNVEGDAGQAKQLGNALGAAVRQELLKQKRPGGLLA